MEPSALLARMSKTFRGDVGPAIADDYARTQAYLSAVVLQKLSRQLELADAHAEAEAADRAALIADLNTLLAANDTPDPIRAAVEALPATRDAGLCTLIECLYANQAELGQARFDAALHRVRQALRRSIDRRMEVAA